MCSLFLQICQGLLANRVTIKANNLKFPLLILLSNSPFMTSMLIQYVMCAACVLMLDAKVRGMHWSYTDLSLKIRYVSIVCDI